MPAILKRAFYVVFVALWAFGLFGYFGTKVRLFMVSDEPVDWLERLRVSFMPNDDSFHPDVYQRGQAEFMPLVADALQDDVPIHIIVYRAASGDDAEDGSFNVRTSELVEQWIYPHIAEVCVVTSSDQIAAQCAPFEPNSLIINVGLPEMPGADCDIHTERYSLCRLSPS